MSIYIFYILVFSFQKTDKSKNDCGCQYAFFWVYAVDHVVMKTTFTYYYHYMVLELYHNIKGYIINFYSLKLKPKGL